MIQPPPKHATAAAPPEQTGNLPKNNTSAQCVLSQHARQTDTAPRNTRSHTLLRHSVAPPPRRLTSFTVNGPGKT